MKTKKEEKYFKSLKLSDAETKIIDKKLGPIFKDKACVICRCRDIFMDLIPLEMRASKKINRKIYHKQLFIRKCCENCGHSQLFDLNILNGRKDLYKE